MKRINWTKTTLGAIADFSNGGAWSQDEYVTDGVRVVRVSDVKGDTLDMSECKFLSVNSLEKYSKNLLKAGDLMICTVGSHPNQPASVVGRAVVIPKNVHGALLNQNAVRLRPCVPSLSAGWLGFLGRSKGFHDYIIGCARGAASQVRMPIGLLKEMPIAVPPTTTQQKIASILSAYDDLIENNTRRIAILEEMARRIYEEWFVRFRFPGHEGVRMVESELGLVPEGWSISPLGSSTKLLSGYAFKSTAFCSDGQYGLVTIKNVHDGIFVEECTNRLPQPPANMPAHCKLKVADILLSLTGNVGRCCLVTIDGCLLNQRVAKIQPVNPADWAYSYLLFRSEALQERLEAIATGVAQQNLSPVESQKLPVVTPPQELRKRFSENVSYLLLLVLALNRKNANLRTTRDLLLPKLISGELDVSTLPEPQAQTA